MTVLAEYGEPKDDALIFEGQRYRLMNKGAQLQIWQKGENRLLFSGTDLREQTGQVDVRQMQMTDAQVANLCDVAWRIKQRNRGLHTDWSVECLRWGNVI